MSTDLTKANELRAKERNEIFTRAERGSMKLKQIACMTLVLMEADEDYKTLGFDSLNKYAEDSAQVNKGTASKMLDAGRVLLATGFLPETPQEQLPDTSYARIYTAGLALPDAGEDEILAHALTLTESQLITKRHAKAAGEHEPSFMEICTVCKVSKAEHD